MPLVSRTCLLLPLLSACVEELQIAPDLEVVPWAPDEQDADVPPAAVNGCEPSEAAESLDPLWCTPVSPEPDSEEFDGGEGGETCGTPGDLRCRYYNLIGASGLSGTATRPVLTYCDSDRDGGVRAASYNAINTGHYNTIVHPRECRGFPQDGGMGSAEGDGLFSSFIRWDEDGENRVYLSEQSPEGAPRGQPQRLPGSENPTRTTVSGDSVFIQFADGSIQVRDLAQPEAPHFVAYESDRFGAGTIGERQVVATCSDAFGFRAIFLDNREVDETLLLGDSCYWDARPAVAGSPDSVAIGWHDGAELQLAFVGDDLRVHARETLDGVHVELAWDGTHFWSLEHTGTLSQWTAQGERLLTFAHPFVPHPDGQTLGLRMLIDDGTLLVAAITEFREEVGGHQSLTNSLDLSAVALP